MLTQILQTPVSPATATLQLASPSPAPSPKTYIHRGYTLILTTAGLTVHYEDRFVGDVIGMAAANTLIDYDVTQRKAHLAKIMGRHENNTNDLI